MEVDIELQPGPLASRQARDELRFALGDRLSREALNDLMLVVTELVTNSVRHGPGRPIQVLVSQDEAGKVRGEVKDQGEGLIAMRDMGSPGQGGYGLRIVDRLTDRWAVYEGSTHVWFEMPLG
jgi:anti-sigma regulatory factor (Ser/Thr protein kinase)